MDKLLEECENYDIENDSEAYGRSLAERCFQTYGTFKIKDIIEEQKNWEKWRTIAFKKFPVLLPRETILVKEIKERLTELKRAGYNIKPGYSQLKKEEEWSYFKEIKKEISSHLNNLVFG